MTMLYVTLYIYRDTDAVSEVGHAQCRFFFWSEKYSHKSFYHCIMFNLMNNYIR